MKLSCFAFILILLVSISSTELSAQEYLWSGANQYQLWFQYKGRIYQQLNAMQDVGLKVLRIFLGHRPYQSWEDPPDAYTFEAPCGSYNDANLEKVDFLMNECLIKRDIKLIVALNNNSDVYFNTYGPIGMYSSSDAIAAYKNRFLNFLNHHNSYLNKTWKDCDDVIYAWEIQNEPGIPLLDVSGLSSTERHDLIRHFLTELSNYLKSIDPNTKVALGIAGYANYYHSGKSGDDIRTLGNIKSADIYTLHFYGGDLTKWINDNLPYCRSINKLLFIEEFGDERNVGMPSLVSLYQSVTQTCRNLGVPWMFWRLGHRKSENTLSINSDDDVWQQVVAPEAALINQTLTTDNWGINNIIPVEDRDSAVGGTFTVSAYPNPFNRNIQFNIQTQNFPIAIRIFNIQGIEIFSDTIVTSESMIRYNWNATDYKKRTLSTGLYLVSITNDIFHETMKVCFIK